MINEFMKKIRFESESLHDMAEHTGFINRLIEGNASKETYGKYIYNLYYVYKAIEDNLEKNKSNENVANFALPDVYRSEEILKDVKSILGEDYEKVPLLMSTKVFVNRINSIGNSDPELLIAHAYTRYLADLFGGRTILEIIKKHYKLEDESLNYYVFPQIKDFRQFVMQYHDKLNALNLSESMQEKFLNEISMSYIYNISISNELEFLEYHKK